MKLNLKEKKSILNFINFVEFKSKKNYILISGELKYTNKIQNNGEIFIPNNKLILKDFLEKEEESFINEKYAYSEGEENNYISDNDVISEDLIITDSDESLVEKNNVYLEKVCYEQFFKSDNRRPIKDELFIMTNIVKNVFNFLFKSKFKSQFFSNLKTYKENPMLNNLMNNTR